jgi:hypothetical protein
MAHCIALNTNRGRVTESVFDETVNSMGQAHKALHPRQILLYDWEKVFADAIHCEGKDVFLAQCTHLCHHGIYNEGHVFVLTPCVKGTVNVYESIRCHEYIEDWSVASALPSASHEARPYFLVKWGQDPHGLMLKSIIGHRKKFGCPRVPSGQIVSFPCVLENVVMESAHCTVTSIALRTRGSLKKSNVKPLSNTVSLHVTTKSS